MGLSKFVRILLGAAAILAALGCQSTTGITLTGTEESTRNVTPVSARERAELRGVLQVPAPLIGLDGATLIGLDGATLQANGKFRLLNLEIKPLPGARVFLADAAGQPVPSVEGVLTDAEGRFVMPAVPVGLSYVVVGEAKTNAGKPAIFRSLVKVGPAGASTAVDAASTLVTAKVVEGLEGGELGNYNPATFQAAVETIARKLTRETLPDFTDLLAVRTKVDELVEEVADLRTQVAQLREDLSRVQATLAEQPPAGNVNINEPAPGAPNATPGGFPENIAATPQASASGTPPPTEAPEVIATPAIVSTAVVDITPVPTPSARVPTTAPDVVKQPMPTQPAVSAYSVSTFAGMGKMGKEDGDPANASFNAPRGLAWGPDDAVYVADTGNQRIRRVDSAGVKTYAGPGGRFNVRFTTPVRAVFDSKQKIYVVDDKTTDLTTVNIASEVQIVSLRASFSATVGSFSDTVPLLARGLFANLTASSFTPSPSLQNPKALAVGSDGTVYVLANHILWQGTLEKGFQPLAGGAAGYADGRQTGALFNSPEDVVWGPDKHLYVADTGNHRIRRVSVEGEVTTFAGRVAGWQDALGTEANFKSPQALAFDQEGNLYVADTHNDRIRKVSLKGEVTTIAGTGAQGVIAGPGPVASLRSPRGICVDPSGNVYVADSGNHRVLILKPI